jgi:hypothetical protein
MGLWSRDEERRLLFAQRMGRAELPRPLLDAAFSSDDPAAWADPQAAAARAVAISHALAGQPVPEPRVVEAEALELIRELQAEWGQPERDSL